MGVREALSRLVERAKEKKAQKEDYITQIRLQKAAQMQQLSSNERELHRFQEEDRQELIKEHLDVARKKRQHDISFNHNPLDVPNMTNHSDFEILKQKNLFKGKGNMFQGQKNTIKSPNVVNTKNIFRSKSGGCL